MANQRDDKLRFSGRLLSISGRVLSTISALLGAILIIITLFCLLGLLGRPTGMGWFVLPALTFGVVSAFFLTWLFGQAKSCGQQIQKGFYFSEQASKSL